MAGAPSGWWERFGVCEEVASASNNNDDSDKYEPDVFKARRSHSFRVLSVALSVSFFTSFSFCFRRQCWFLSVCLVRAGLDARGGRRVQIVAGFADVEGEFVLPGAVCGFQLSSLVGEEACEC